MTVAAIAPPRKMPWDTTLTWDDLAAMPDDGLIYENIDGELWVMAPPIPIHQELVSRLMFAFILACDGGRRGKVYSSPIGVQLAEHDIVEPDVLFIARDRLDIVKGARIIGAPDIVVEIFSPSTRSKDRHEKADLYARAGVPEYWQIDPRRQTGVVLVLRDGAYRPLPQEDGIARSSVLPDLAVDIAVLFADLS